MDGKDLQCYGAHEVLDRMCEHSEWIHGLKSAYLHDGAQNTCFFTFVST